MEYLKDFGLDGELNTTINKMRRKSHRSFSDVKISGGLIRQFTYSSFVEVTAGLLHQRNQNGKVIFANDPHIGFSQPGTWYEAHIVTLNLNCMAAIWEHPFLYWDITGIMHTATMFQNDDIDFYQENSPDNDNKYKTPTGFSDYITRKEIIKVKDSTDVVLNVKISRHGPVMNGLIAGLDDKKPVAMS
jgi:penicillin amidase